MKSFPDEEEKVKPYRLLKYFTFTSLVLVFIGALILSALFTHGLRSINRTKSEDYARLLIANLNHQVFYQFNIPVAWKYEKIQLRDKEQFELMDSVVRNALHGFQVDMVHIYNKSNIISYSFDPSQMGKENEGGAAYQKALQGETTAELVQRGSFWEILLGIPKEVKIVTFAPLRAENPTLIFVRGKGIVFSPTQEQDIERESPILGVFEIVLDLRGDYKRIFEFQKMMVISLTIVLGSLFLVLRFVVKRGEETLFRRSLEKLAFKERLARAERLSALGELTAGISHEIRNPLGIIRSSAELLQKKMAVHEPGNPIPGIIVEESVRLNAIITDFLNFAMPKTPHLLFSRVEDLIDKTILFFEPQLAEKKISLHRHYGEDLPPILVDSSMLHQAFLNILINAVHALEEGGRIDVAARKQDQGVVIAFTDTGPGIPEDLLGKIWDPFFTTKETGSGLGLGIVRNIIQSHEGSVQVENSPTGGAVITVFLPVEREETNGNHPDRR